MTPQDVLSITPELRQMPTGWIAVSEAGSELRIANGRRNTIRGCRVLSNRTQRMGAPTVFARSLRVVKGHFPEALCTCGDEAAALHRLDGCA
jgi:hypothetical protein